MTINKLLKGFDSFCQQYASSDINLMAKLAKAGQTPEIMMVACSDSRVDPALLFQCDPGELFILRNVANLVPPYECDHRHHGTSAALEFGICYLKVKHLVILAHSQCGGIQAHMSENKLIQNDFLGDWLSLLHNAEKSHHPDECAQNALLFSYQNCLTFPWIQQALNDGTLKIHLWFFDILQVRLKSYDFDLGWIDINMDDL
jgi:carbonic anhydrase